MTKTFGLALAIVALAGCSGGGTTATLPPDAGQQRGGITVERVPLMDPAPTSGDAAPATWNGQTFSLSPCVPVRDFSTWPTMAVVGNTCGPITAPPYTPPASSASTAYYTINGVSCYAETYSVAYSASGAIGGFYCLSNPYR